MNRLVLTVLFLFVFTSFLEAAPPDPDLSVYLDFDEISGDVIKDKSGNGNDGMLLQNADLEEGKFGKALKFTAGLRVEFDGENFVKPPEEAVTIAVWANTEPRSAEMEVFDCIGSGHGDGLYHVEIRSDGAMRWYHRDDSSTQIFSIQTGSVPVGEWVHIAGTYDSDAGQAVLYINGAEITRAAGGGKLSIDWSVTAGLGQHKGGRQFLGLMDEFYMFQRALDLDEIIALMNGEFGPSIAVQPGGKLAAMWGRIKL
jgi:hypothetical protein